MIKLRTCKFINGMASDDTGELRCAECGQSVGQLDRLVLRYLIAIVFRVH
jgi:hypothetical protein